MKLKTSCTEYHPPTIVCRFVIILLLVLQPIIGILFHDFYPFSSFPMFSNLRNESITYKVTTDKGYSIQPHILDLAFYDLLNDYPRLSGSLPDGYSLGNHRYSLNEIKLKLIRNFEKLSDIEFHLLEVEETVMGKLNASKVGVISNTKYKFNRIILTNND